MWRQDPIIPIVIDDIKRFEELPLTRCTYFSIEHEQQHPFELPLIVYLSSIESGIMLLGLSGIVIQPNENNVLFDSADAFESLYENIERLPGLFIDINEIWFPNQLFCSEGHARGSIFRVSVGLFKLADTYQRDLITQDEFISSSYYFEGQLEHSPQETEALASWNHEQISNIRETYHSLEPELRLQKKKSLARE